MTKAVVLEHWTDEERGVLKYMFAKDKSDAQIGKALGRTAKAISMERSRLGLVKKFHAPKIAKVEPIVAKNHSENLPDVGEQLFKIHMVLARIEIVMKDQLELFKKIDSIKRPEVSNGKE